MWLCILYIERMRAAGHVERQESRGRESRSIRGQSALVTLLHYAALATVKVVNQQVEGVLEVPCKLCMGFARNYTAASSAAGDQAEVLRRLCDLDHGRV